MLTRETISLVVPVLTIIVGVALLTACPQPPQSTPPTPVPTQSLPAVEPDPAEPGEPADFGEPITVDINLSETEVPMMDDSFDDEEGIPIPAPEDVQYSVSLKNNFLEPEEPYDLNFRYEALVFRGMRTFLLNDPDDLTSGYVSDENGPIYYYVLESETGVLESKGLSDDAELDYWFVTPEDTYVIRYWVEIVVEKGHAETDFTGVPWIRPDDVILQGRLITEEDID